MSAVRRKATAKSRPTAEGSPRQSLPVAHAGCGRHDKEMSCSHCADLCQELLIQTPGELEKMVRVVGVNLQDGTLAEISGATRSTEVIEPTLFADLIASEPWPDMIKADFRCANCGELFHLRCETYHGSGGRWSSESHPSRFVTG